MSFLQLDIRPKASGVLFILLTLLHVLAITVLFIIQIWLWAKCIVFVFVVLNWYQVCWGIILLKKPRAITRIIFRRGDWQILDGAGYSREVCLLGQTYLSALLIILHFCDLKTRRKKTLVLARDSLDRQTFRRLKVILRNSF